MNIRDIIGGVGSAIVGIAIAVLGAGMIATVAGRWFPKAQGALFGLSFVPMLIVAAYIVSRALDSLREGHQ